MRLSRALSKRFLSPTLALLVGAAALAAWRSPAARAQEGGEKEYKPVFPKDLPFEAKEWQTCTDYPALGDPRAKRDSQEAFVVRWDSYPPTLRTQGPNSNLQQTHMFHDLMYESLIGLHPETLQYIPTLATHWKIETDEKAGTQTFWFRINPNARWADGSPVTADDVHKTWWHRVQEDRKDPSNLMIFKRFEEPEVLDRLTIRVKTKELHWQLFLDFGGMAIYPAKYINVPGDRYIEDYNWKFMMGSGPYYMKPEDLKKDESLTITRRKDWWAENEPWAKNTCNFAKIKGVLVQDEELEYEKFKKGDLPFYFVTKAQRWVEEIPKEDIVKNGWVKRRKVYNQATRSFSGLAMNMREKPFDDKRVRLAFCHLFNRERLMEKLFFNEYEYVNSHWPGSDWGNEQANEPTMYDPDKATQLLAEAGFKTRDGDGFLLGRDGKPFEVTLEFAPSAAFERIFLVVREDFRKAGVKFELSKIERSTLIKKLDERKFRLHFQSWATTSPFPDPELMWMSDLAEKGNNTNICGFKNARVDELCKKFNVTFDRAEQKKITREVDSLVFDEHPYALAWFAPYFRLMYWDKFGHPDTYLQRTSDNPYLDIMSTWWFDDDKAKALAEAKGAGKPLEQGDVDVKPWDKKK